MAKYQSPALEKGLDILEYLSLLNTAQSQTEIGSGKNKNPNEIYRMLVCLEEKGYIDKSQVSGKYSLSLKLYHLSHRHPPINSLRMAALYPMQELSEYTQQSCHLSILYKNDVLLIAQSLSPGPISLSIEVGSKFPVYETTSGRVILSQFEKSKQLFYLDRVEQFRGLSKDEKADYLDQLDRIRNQGYDMRESETTIGVLDIVVPFSIPEIEIIGALAVTILSGQIQKSLTKDKILKKAQTTIEQMYKTLGVIS